MNPMGPARRTWALAHASEEAVEHLCDAEEIAEEDEKWGKRERKRENGMSVDPPALRRHPSLRQTVRATHLHSRCPRGSSMRRHRAAKRQNPVRPRENVSCCFPPFPFHVGRRKYVHSRQRWREERQKGRPLGRFSFSSDHPDGFARRTKVHSIRAEMCKAAGGSEWEQRVDVSLRW